VNFDELFAHTPIMAILRNVGVATSLQLAQKAWSVGIDVVEVTVQSEQDLDALHAVAEQARAHNKVVGAGTILSPQQLPDVAQAGAAFTVSPGFDTDVLQASLESRLPHLPGVATPTEVQAALSQGVQWLKAFPAAHLGPDWFKTVRGPFPQVKFVATGGIDASNAQAFLSAGVELVAVGSALADPSQLDKLSRLINP